MLIKYFLVFGFLIVSSFASAQMAEEQAKEEPKVVSHSTLTFQEFLRTKKNLAVPLAVKKTSAGTAAVYTFIGNISQQDLWGKTFVGLDYLKETENWPACEVEMKAESSEEEALEGRCYGVLAKIRKTISSQSHLEGLLQYKELRIVLLAPGLKDVCLDYQFYLNQKFTGIFEPLFKLLIEEYVKKLEPLKLQDLIGSGGALEEIGAWFKLEAGEWTGNSS